VLAACWLPLGAPEPEEPATGPGGGWAADEESCEPLDGPALLPPAEPPAAPARGPDESGATDGTRGTERTADGTEPTDGAECTGVAGTDGVCGTAGAEGTAGAGGTVGAAGTAGADADWADGTVTCGETAGVLTLTAADVLVTSSIIAPANTMDAKIQRPTCLGMRPSLPTGVSRRSIAYPISLPTSGSG
jgi:hypothetical protein